MTDAPGQSGIASQDINCRCFVRYKLVSEEEYVQLTGKNFEGKPFTEDKNSDIIKAGAISGARNPLGKKAETHAVAYYESVRHMKTDVARIAKTTGFSEKEIQDIKNFIFYDKHDLGDGEPKRFEPDFMMAESWKRLINGTPEAHDITMIKHEITERKLIIILSVAKYFPRIVSRVENLKLILTHRILSVIRCLLDLNGVNLMYITLKNICSQI